MNEAKQRRHFTGQEKMAILRRHLVERAPVSQLCDEYRLQPTLFYRWQKDLFENGAAVFDASGRNASASRGEDAAAKRIAALEAKLRNKNEVVAELLEEHIQLKKELGVL